MLVTWNTETLMYASSPEKGGCGMNMIIRYIGETMRDAATSRGEREREIEAGKKTMCLMSLHLLFAE